MKPRFERLAMVARWKPLHLGQQRVLEGLLKHCRHLTVGIGSANRYNCDNPFRASESEAMLRLVLPEQVPILHLDDLDNPPRWAAQLASRLGPQDALVTANPWVREWMEPYYPVIHPVHFVPTRQRIAVEGKMVRAAWQNQQAWEQWVSPQVAEYLHSHGLVERFRSEFAS